MAFTHNSTLADSEPDWGTVDKSKLPLKAFDWEITGTDPESKSTWKLPHHWVKGGGKLDDNGIYEDGEMYLHRGGVMAAYGAMMGARGGTEGMNPQAKAHMMEHYDHMKAMEEEKKNKMRKLFDEVGIDLDPEEIM